MCWLAVSCASRPRHVAEALWHKTELAVTHTSRSVDSAAVISSSVSTESNRSGVMLVRVWVHEGQLVARLQSSRSGETDQSAQMAVGLAQIQETVQQWLRDLEGMTQ